MYKWLTFLWLLGVLTLELACSKPAAVQRNAPPLILSLPTLALKANGFDRVITIKASTAVKHVKYTLAPALPTGSRISPADCGDMKAGGTCELTIHPGSKPSAAAGVASKPSRLRIQGVNTPALTTEVTILAYGSYYQQGYVFALNDSTPAHQSVGATMMALTDNHRQMAWHQGAILATKAMSLTNGALNTLKIHAHYPTELNAVNLCATYTIDASSHSPCQAGAVCYSHWYLPSICELGPAAEQADCAQKTANIVTNVVLTPYGLGDLSGAYWSSTEINAGTAWVQNFVQGDANAQLSMAKDFQLSVRCVRNSNS